MDLCLPTGTADRIIVSRKHGQDLYTAARKSTWGDLFYIDHVIDAEVEISDHPRRKWKERAQEAKDAKITRGDNVENIFSAELTKLGIEK